MNGREHKLAAFAVSVLIVMAGLLTACEQQFGTPTVAEPVRWSYESKTVYFNDFVAVTEACKNELGLQISGEGKALGCAKPFHQVGDRTVCVIYMIRPAGFHDSLGMETLGHEHYHCQLARHP